MRNRRGGTVIEYAVLARGTPGGGHGSAEQHRPEDSERSERCRERTELMLRAVPSCLRVLACRRGSTMVGYSSLALLVAIAAITLLGHADTETGGASSRRAAGSISSN